MTPTCSRTRQTLILALNAGSSSLKASLMEGDSKHLAQFLGERLNTKESVLHLPGQQGQIVEQNMSHEKALTHVLEYLKKMHLFDDLVAIGHRVVHGGTIFSQSAVVGDKELQQLKSVAPLAPLHNPHNIAGIETMKKLLRHHKGNDNEDEIPNVAVFDTSFHSTIPEVAYTYPIPKEYRAQNMRKFGFHGTSVNYITLQATQILQHHLKPETTSSDYNMIICHLGNGASITAVSNGRSMETSMGFTPLSGLMMGTRCGSIDPSLTQYACQTLGKTVDEVTQDFNKRSGLKAITLDGDSDMRVLLKLASKEKEKEKEASTAAQLAIDMFVYRLAQHIASSMIALEGPLDAIVFTAGIGEHSEDIRKMTLEKLQKTLLHDLKVDDERNKQHGHNSNGVITTAETWPLALVIATDEEKMIAKECLRVAGIRI